MTACLRSRKIWKKKLFERISPKKTIEGFVGGLSQLSPVIWFQNIISKSPKEKYLFGS
jgi:CDP-diglyceride synthetase